MGARLVRKNEFLKIKRLLKAHTGAGSKVSAVAKYAGRSLETVRVINMHSTWESYLHRKHKHGYKPMVNHTPQQPVIRTIVRTETSWSNLFFAFALGFAVGAVIFTW